MKGDLRVFRGARTPAGMAGVSSAVPCAAPVAPALDVVPRRFVPGRIGVAAAAALAALLPAVPPQAAMAAPETASVQPPPAVLAADVSTVPGTPPPATDLRFSPGPFNDLLPGYWALPAITRLAQAGLALTPSPNTFDPYTAQTRGAWAEQVVLALLPSTPTPPQQPPFPDVPVSNAAGPEIAAAAQLGWIPFPTDSGYQPDAPVTREEALALLGTALLGKSAVQAAAGQPLPFVDAGQVSPWAKGPIMALYEAGYVSGLGDGRIDPQGSLQRDDAAALLDRVLQHLLTSGGHRYRVLSVRQMRATTYGAGEGVGGHTATGTPVHLGEAAADPAALPYGSVLFVTGYNGRGYLPTGGLLERIEDTGMLGPNDIDLYMPANSPWPYDLFGIQTVTAYVLDPTPVA